MKRLILILIFALTMTVHAQDDSTPTGYRLRVPSINDYVNRVGIVLEKAQSTFFVNYPFQETRYAESYAINAEINWRYLSSDQMTFDQINGLLKVYQDSRNYDVFPDENWIAHLLENWLRENPDALRDVNNFPNDNNRTVMLDEYGVRLSDLGTSLGYLMEVTQTSNTPRGSFIAIRQDDGGYFVPELPYPIYDDLLASGDLNGDGDFDIAYVYNEHSGNGHNYGKLYIVTLHDRQFKVLQSLDYYERLIRVFPPETYTWRFVNMDNENDKELIQVRVERDNWGCEPVSTSLFDWTPNGGNTLEQKSIEWVLPDSFNCLFQQAEEALWQHQYDEAIALYQKALATHETEEQEYPYAQLRLGFTYFLAGQQEEAEAIIATLPVETIPLAAAFQDAYRKDSRVLAVCQALYEEPVPSILMGAITTYSGGFSFGDDPNYDHENATCDLPHFLDIALTTINFDTAVSPIEQLEALGLKVSDSIHTDYDEDGNEEWLVWVSPDRIDPILFTPEANIYHISRLDRWYIDIPGERNQYHIIDLPGNAGKALLNVDFMRDYYSDTGTECGMCIEGKNCLEDAVWRLRPIADVRIWRLQNGEVVKALDAPHCNLSEPEDLFLNGQDTSELHVGKYSFPNPELDYGVVIPATYQWDAASQTYVEVVDLTTTPAPSPEPTAIPEIMSTPAPEIHSVELRIFGSLNDAFVNGDYELVLTMTGGLADVSPDTAMDATQAFGYYRAMALEALNRPDEALTEYVAVYEAAPDSAWGLLAELHLEKVE